jgi:hypothetical protein
MCEYVCCSPWGCVIGVLVAIAWWLFASGLLLCAWNSVVASIANVKKAKYWQAMVIVLTLVVLSVPFWCGEKSCVGAWCGSDREHHGYHKSRCNPSEICPGHRPCETEERGDEGEER